MNKDYELLYTKSQAYEFADDDKELKKFPKPDKEGPSSDPLAESLSNTLIHVIENINEMMRGLSKVEESKNTFGKAAEKLMTYLQNDLKAKTKKEFGKLDGRILNSMTEKINKNEEIMRGVKLDERSKECDKCRKNCMSYEALTLSCRHTLDLACLAE